MDIRQLLSQGYQAADRFLPFDGLLDPMFNPPPRRPMPQDVGATPNMQSRFVPQFPQVAGAPAPMPQSAPGPAPMTVPKRGGGFGRTLMEFIDPAFNDRADKREATAAAQDQRQKLFSYAQSVITDPREWLVFQSDPEAWAKARATGYEAYTLSQGGMRGQDGETTAYNPALMSIGRNVVASSSDGSVEKVFTADPTPDEMLKLQAAQDGEWVAVGGNWWRKPPGGGKPEKGPPLTAEPKVFAPQRPSVGGRSNGAAGAVPDLAAIEAELRRRGAL